MVSYPMFYRTGLTVDTSHTQKFFDEEDSSILDENILDQNALDSGLEMSPPMGESRRDSFAVSAGLFSPKTEDWQSVEMQSVPSNNPFLDPHSNNPFLRMDQQSQQQAYQSHGWSMTSSGAATPLQAFDGLPTNDYDSSVPLFHRPATMQAQTPFSNTSNQVAMFQQLGQHGVQSIPTSPQKDLWMSQDLKNQVMKRPRPASPLIRSHNELRRGDGIRKKNARFDIPAERNLSNIDHLISQSTDEQEIKELKQQKRLLRNRQAALDSRQRKKQHTERLEDEKKQFTEVITSLEDQVAKLESDMERLMRDNQSYEAYITEMERKQEEMISRHTIETGELRKKVSVLTNHVQTLEGAAAEAAPSSTSFSGVFGEMDGITMDGAWENMQLFGDFPMEQPAEVKQEVQIVPAKKVEVALPVDCEKPAQQGGLLFMLFLVGAFVLSSRSTPSIPQVSDDVRAASATLLENVLKDAGVPQTTSSMEAMAPRPSGNSCWSQAQAPTLSIAHPAMDNVAPSMLGDMADALMQPTEQQTNEQLFSISAAQYNGLSSQDFPQNAPAERSTSQGRRNLADALANMRSSNKQSAAEVYTRSLLWDQIPSDVVRSFAKMVAECNTQSAGGSSDAET